jgi:hypothetical protein
MSHDAEKMISDSILSLVERPSLAEDAQERRCADKLEIEIDNCATQLARQPAA